MKNIIALLISGFLTLSLSAQTITLTFNGTNKNRNYQVLLDGTSYYSNSVTDPNSTNTNVRKEITLTNQQLGSHTIAVYRLRNTGTYSNGTNTPTSGTAIYTNTFQLRTGYDMHISINGNGQVTFREQRIRNKPNRGNQVTINPMTDASFNQLLSSVRGRFSQSSKFNVAREAFVNTSNYFSTNQVKQILLLINSEANRLSLAKLAYPRVTDANNFTTLYDVFATVRSRDDMNAFIRANPNTINTNTANWNNNPKNNTNNTSTKSPMADYQFTQLLQTVNNQWNQLDKVNAITTAFNNTSNYFTTSQLRQLLSLVTAESDRLALAKIAYARASDVSTFTSLYDLFYSQASRDELNNFIGVNVNISSTSRTAMADYQFNQLLQNVNGQWNQAGKFNIVRDALISSTNWFSTVQIRQLLSLVTSESDRLSLAKLSYARVTDPVNFTSLYDLLNSQASKNELNAYVIQQGGTGITVQTNITGRTPVSDAVFQQLYQKARNHIRPSSTIEDLREFFNNSSYFFSTAQIRQLLALVSNSILSSETDMLEVAKLSWHRVTDPVNFPDILNLFTSQVNRDALKAYIEARPY